VQRATVGGITLEFETRGAGEPVILIHGSMIADSYLPIMSEPALARFRLVRYRRRGFGASTHSAPPVSIADQAADCAGLMRQLGIERAHVVGHSYGGVIALELARGFPQAVHSMALLEPALMNQVPGGVRFMESFAPVIVRYQGGDKIGALEGFMGAVAGPKWRSALDALSGAFAMALKDEDNFFQVEVPAMGPWGFTREDAARISQPIVAIVGAESEPIFGEIQELVKVWFPRAEARVIAGAAHMLQMEQPRAVAEVLADFFARHPMRR
jgi:pimeloyl-ACP methyl ester carboxylesterase